MPRRSRFADSLVSDNQMGSTSMLPIFIMR